ncbi:MAG: carboxylesterase family protein [Clostridiales bacterium]|nr:carboxylesterase family protein [Clostridiales bacterium]
MSQASDSVRMNFGKGDDIRDAGLTTPDTIQRFDDLRYGNDADCQLLDVYRPKEAHGEVLPVIISVHGGGWVYGDKERYQYYCMSLAERGFSAVTGTVTL